MSFLLKSRIVWTITLLLVAGGICWYVIRPDPNAFDPWMAFNPGRNAPEPEILWTAPPPINPKAVALIDKLVEVSEEGLGTHSTAWASGFIGSDEPIRFRGGILGSHAPVVDPAMRELVRMGVAAMPDLLNHVSDPRKTKLKSGLKMPGIGAQWDSDEYAPRYRDTKRQPKNVNTGRDFEGEAFDGAHTIRVGDLCYVAVGQIVNRHLYAIRYQPTACLVINSPIRTTALAEAVRQDWSGLTREDHQQSLIDDALRRLSYGALSRLYFYYPEVADSVALKLLERPLYDVKKVTALTAERATDPEDPPFIDTTTESDRQYLLEALAPIQSEKLQEALRGIQKVK